MGVTVEFRVLGPLEVSVQGQLVPVGAPRTRAVLALLLTPPNTIVSVDRFVDEFWPSGPPAGARDLLHDQLSRLRRALRSGPFKQTGETVAARLVTRKPGYLLRVEEDELDRDRYERLLAEARAASEAGQLERCVTRYRDADQLWRGAPLADVPATPGIAATVAALTELRMNSLERRYEVGLRLGEDADLVAELTTLVAEHPFRERLVGQLIRAQYSAGHAAAALATYDQARRLLADELGLDPGPELRRLERVILRR